MLIRTSVGQVYILCLWVYNSVGWVSKFSDTCPIPFSQNSLQKSPVFTFFFLKIYAAGQGINLFLEKWTSSHNTGSHKFENSRLSIKILTNRLLFFQIKKISIFFNYWFFPSLENQEIIWILKIIIIIK